MASYNTNFDIFGKKGLLTSEKRRPCFASVRDWLRDMTHLVYYPQPVAEDIKDAEEYIGMKYRDLQIWYLRQMEDFGFTFNSLDSKDGAGGHEENLNYCIEHGFRVDKRNGIRQIFAETTIIRHMQEAPNVLFAFYEMLRQYPALGTSLERRFAAFGLSCINSNPMKVEAFHSMNENNSEHSLFPYNNRFGDIYGINSVKHLLEDPIVRSTLHSISSEYRIKNAPDGIGYFITDSMRVEVKSQIEWIINNVK